MEEALTGQSCGELDEVGTLMTLLHKQDINKENWLARMSTVVTKIISGWRIPLCARKTLAD